ncbi:MAG: hypothetical protein ACFFBD_27815 [Candidatus Hodarchaeota archaeon]
MSVIRTPGGRKKVSCHICEPVVKVETWAEQARLLRTVRGKNRRAKKQRSQFKEKILNRLKSTRSSPKE